MSIPAFPASPQPSFPVRKESKPNTRIVQLLMMDLKTEYR